MKGDFGYVADTIIRISRVPSDQADAAAMTFKVIKNRGQPVPRREQCLRECLSSELYCLTPGLLHWLRKGDDWIFTVVPGDLVMRKRLGNVADGPLVPDGMVVATSKEEMKERVLVLFFR